ncbi:hypothetical protein KL86DPRO_10130 [uncultured delta proteobacterium]|uniref:Uncharacterized protein n=1 Tax=uncultured delta proteobacterium TaxID=34034 RepID=A0A212IV17_9DELT|nr:hypothetical protein KL86DPRO_10130 [uncultured delta proteobacterium]
MTMWHKKKKFTKFIDGFFKI